MLIIIIQNKQVKTMCINLNIETKITKKKTFCNDICYKCLLLFHFSMKICWKSLKWVFLYEDFFFVQIPLQIIFLFFCLRIIYIKFNMQYTKSNFIETYKIDHENFILFIVFILQKANCIGNNMNCPAM